MADIYVAPTPMGSDTSGDGSQSLPYATISKAYAVASATDRIRLLPGTHLSSQINLTRNIWIEGVSEDITDTVVSVADAIWLYGSSTYKMIIANFSIHANGTDSIRHGVFKYIGPYSVFSRLYVETSSPSSLFVIWLDIYANVAVYNCTVRKISGNLYYIFYSTASQTPRPVVKNMIANHAMFGLNVTSEGNNIYPGGTGADLDYSLYGDAGIFAASPGPALLLEGPAVDAGATVPGYTDSYYGTGPDIGAVECTVIVYTPVAAGFVGMYGLYEAHLEQGLAGIYHLLAPIDPVGLVGLYSLVLEQAFVGRYGDASLVRASLVGRYGDASLVRASLVGRYGDLVRVIAGLEGRYHLMHSAVAALDGRYAICGATVLAGLNGRYDLRARNEIMAALAGYYSLLPGATVQQIVCPVRIGGSPVRWSNVSWTLSEDSYLIESTIVLRDAAEFYSVAKLDTVEIDWSGTTYALFVAAKPRSRSVSGDPGAAEYGADYTIVARSLTAALDAPYALPVTMSWPATTLASAIAADLIATLSDLITLDWRLEDWLQPGGTFFVTEESPLEGLRKLAGIIGGIVQTSPDNAVILRMADTVPPAEWATVPPAWTIEDSGLFSDSESEQQSNRYNVITVSNQGESDRSTRFIVEDLADYRKQVKGYRVPWTDFGLATSGGEWVTIEDGGIVEELVADEIVEFVDGSSTSSLPVYSQVSAVWLQAQLGAITAAEDGSLVAEIAGQSLARISYTTRCHVWIGTSDRDEEVQFYEVDL